MGALAASTPVRKTWQSPEIQDANVEAGRLTLPLDQIPWPTGLTAMCRMFAIMGRTSNMTHGLTLARPQILSTWEHLLGRGINGLQALTDTVGPPARSIILRDGGIKVIKDVADMPEAMFTDADVRNLPVLKQHEDSVINSVTIEGTTIGSISSGVLNTRPLEYQVLDGLEATERVNVARRILAAYQNGLTSLSMEFNADDARNQSQVAALMPGRVIQLDSTYLGGVFNGPVSGLQWEWKDRRAAVRASIEVQPPAPVLTGFRLYATVFYQDTNDDFQERLGFFDVGTGLITVVDVGDPSGGSGTLPVIRALAYDGDTDTLWGVRSTGNIYRLINIDTSTGVGTDTGIDTGAVLGMAYRPVDGKLYMVGIGGLKTYEVATQTFATIVSSGLSSTRGLAYAPELDVFYGVSAGFEGPYTLTPQGGETVGSDIVAGIRPVRGLAYDHQMQRLYGATETGIIYHIALNPLALNRIGSTDDFGLALGAGDAAVFGLAYMQLSTGGGGTPAAAFEWRFDTLIALETYFDVTLGSSNGQWEFESGGSTGSGNTGPSPNNNDPFVHTEASSNNGESSMETNSPAVALADANDVLHDEGYRYPLRLYQQSGVYHPRPAIPGAGDGRRHVDDHRHAVRMGLRRDSERRRYRNRYQRRRFHGGPRRRLAGCNGQHRRL